VALLVVHGDAALADQAVLVLAKLLGRGDAVAGCERVEERLLQGERVDSGGGPAAGDGLPERRTCGRPASLTVVCGITVVCRGSVQCFASGLAGTS
jgi:hypothetical protein